MTSTLMSYFSESIPKANPFALKPYNYLINKNKVISVVISANIFGLTRVHWNNSQIT